MLDAQVVVEPITDRLNRLQTPSMVFVCTSAWTHWPMLWLTAAWIVSKSSIPTYCGAASV